MATDPSSLDLSPYVVSCKVPGDLDVYVCVNDSTPEAKAVGGWIVGRVGDAYDELLTNGGTWSGEELPVPEESRFPDARTALTAALNHPRTGNPPEQAFAPEDVDPAAAEYLETLRVGDVLIREVTEGRWGAAVAGDGVLYLMGVGGRWVVAGLSYWAGLEMERWSFPDARTVLAAVLDRPLPDPA